MAPIIGRPYRVQPKDIRRIPHNRIVDRSVPA
uniref:Uncharacterized protein n=1 Tax=Myoviridae sp. ctMb725 TaxID=2825088 RepID=A0A8S5PUP7_9CAUD|nr:MAG TPA: hypothetical protein [Myoviridae sp. ctMb725]